MSNVLRFLWIAFRQYWATWVTGTGLAGFALWVINYISDRVRSKPMSLRTNLTILFCFFWFLGTFSAWHDADKNLITVTQQRAYDNGKLNVCDSDFKAEHYLTGVLQSQLNSAQLLVGGQQSAINSCVTVLAVRDAAEAPKVTLKIAPGAIKTMDESGKPILVKIFVLQTNKPVAHLTGVIGCPSPMEVKIASLAGEFSTGMAPERLSDREFRINVISPGWNPAAPFVFGVGFHDDKGDACSFKLQ
jgi:hypothetical protein